MKIYYSNCISWQLLVDKVYIINEKTKEIHVLADTAKDFWILIKNNHSLEEILKILSDKYSVSIEILENDMYAFKDDLLSKNLIIEGEYCYE